MTDLIANPDCQLCSGTGIIREQRPDYWGMPAYENVMCDCFEGLEELDDEIKAYSLPEETCRE